MRVKPATVVALTVLCACLIAAPFSLAERTAGKPTAAQIKKLKHRAEKKVTKAVKKELASGADPSLAPATEPATIKIRSCKQKKHSGKFAGFSCAWNASGQLPGVVPFKCDGKATVDAKAKKVKKLDRCKNEEELQAPLLATPHSVNFGYFETFDTLTDLWDEMAASGADTALLDINWESLQPSPGGAPSSWNWAPYDPLYNNAVAAGTPPVWNLLDAPCWAAPSGACNASATNPPASAHVGDYATVAAEIAKRYPQSRAVEVWLEPNGPFWGAKPDPALFSRLVGASADAVHASGTQVAVFAGGLAPGSADPDKQEFGSFLKDALAAGGIERADAIGFHAVTATPFGPGDDPTGAYLGRLRIQLQTMRSALDAAGVSKPLSITQLSYNSTGPGAYTEAQQAEAYVSSLNVFQRIANVSIVIVNHLLDNGDGSKVQGFGVLRANRSKKPAYCQLAAARGAPTPSGC